MKNVGSRKNTKTTLSLERIAFLSAKPAAVVPLSAANMAVPATLRVLVQNTEELYIYPGKIIHIL